ncbi:MAG: Kae1-associated serine/threonine protein kinase [Thaumarchaeota archaeon]|nr:Kae1-associated serine/threonine protein kinase [Nitrososphaerota archaeon]
MKLIKKGAEADIYLTSWNGNKSILKSREKKDYRNPTLDRRIREHRTIHESSIMSDVKSFGVCSPLVCYVDTKMCKIYMQHMKGKLVRDLSNQKVIKACEDIGKIVGKLHKNGIMHGDLTTSNFLSMKNKVFVIDFGLAQRTDKIEDHAIDLRLFKEILNSAHADIMEKSWAGFLKGYKKIIGSSRHTHVLSQVSVIESRGRYANVV